MPKTRPIKKLSIFLLFFSLHISSQETLFPSDIEPFLQDYKKRSIENNEFVWSFAAGMKLNIGWQRNGSLRGFASIGFLQSITKKEFETLIGIMSEIEVYRGGLGTSVLNQEKFKLNIEMRNTFTAILGVEDGRGRVNGKPGFVTVAADRSVLFNPMDVSFSFGTTFINGINHKRNQQIGNASLSIYNLHVEYYNDATPFNLFALADGYDRYWTGGGQIGFYFKRDDSLITDFIMRFDNYTGFQANLFEVAGNLKIDNLPYYDKKQQMFNQASIQFKLGVKNTMFLNFSVFEPVYTDIQNIIHHRLSNSPFHARPLDTRFTIGLDYIYRDRN